LNLEKPVESRKSAQAPGPYSYMKKVFITNKVTSHFFITWILILLLTRIEGIPTL